MQRRFNVGDHNPDNEATWRTIQTLHDALSVRRTVDGRF